MTSVLIGSDWRDRNSRLMLCGSGILIYENYGVMKNGCEKSLQTRSPGGCGQHIALGKQDCGVIVSFITVCCRRSSLHVVSSSSWALVGLPSLLVLVLPTHPRAVCLTGVGHNGEGGDQSVISTCAGLGSLGGWIFLIIGAVFPCCYTCLFIFLGEGGRSVLGLKSVNDIPE